MRSLAPVAVTVQLVQCPHQMRSIASVTVTMTVTVTVYSVLIPLWVVETILSQAIQPHCYCRDSCNLAELPLVHECYISVRHQWVVKFVVNHQPHQHYCTLHQFSTAQIYPLQQWELQEDVLYTVIKKNQHLAISPSHP